MPREKSESLRRTTIFVYDDQWSGLKEVAKRRRVPVSYVLRDAIVHYLKTNAHERGE